MYSFASLYSGSSGNCTVVAEGERFYIVDMGGSCRAAVAGIQALGLDPANACGIFLTHEHIDHVAALPQFLRHFNVPVFARALTAEYIEQHFELPAFCAVEAFEDSVCFGDAEISAFHTPHDSLSCCGYRFDFPDRAFAVATDVGTVTDTVFEALSGCRAVALESNYDDYMLRAGRYHPTLKRRILSDLGHLSNFECALVASRLAAGGMKRLMLMHLSRDNNTPDLALTTTLSELENNSFDCAVTAAPRYNGTGLFEI